MLFPLRSQFMLLLNIREVSRDISVHMCAVCDPEVSTVTFCLFNLVLIFILTPESV